MSFLVTFALLAVLQFAAHYALLLCGLPGMFSRVASLPADRRVIADQKAYIVALEKRSRDLEEAASAARFVNVANLDGWRLRNRRDGAS